MKIKSGFELTEERPGYYIARAVGERAAEFPDGIMMGLSGAFLWDKLTKADPARAELIFALDNLFEGETSTDQIAEDVDTFLNFLRANNLLEE